MVPLAFCLSKGRLRHDQKMDLKMVFGLIGTFHRNVGEENNKLMSDLIDRSRLLGVGLGVSCSSRRYLRVFNDQNNLKCQSVGSRRIICLRSS